MVEFTLVSFEGSRILLTGNRQEARDTRQIPRGIPLGHICGGIAQLGEHLPCKQGVNGSIPFISTNFFP